MIYSTVAGVISALLFIGMFLFPSVFVRQLLALISPLSLALVGLSMGLNAAIIASGVGGMIMIVAFPSATIMYYIIDAIPVLAITYLFVRVYENKENPVNLSIGKILSIMSLACCGFMIVFLLVLPYQQLGEAAGIKAETLPEFLYALLSNQFPVPKNMDVELWKKMINTVVSYFPSALFVSWLFRAIVVMVIAQQLVASKDKMLRGTPDYSKIELPLWTVIPVIVFGIGTVVTSGNMEYIFNNSFVVMLLPFSCLGLAQVHQFVRRFKIFALPLLVVFYIILFSGYTYGMLLVSLLGLFEFFINQKLIKDKILRE